jgi:hypothetical protein
VQLSNADTAPHELIVPPQQVVDEFVVYVQSVSTDGGPEVIVTSPHRDPTLLAPFAILLRREAGSLFVVRENLPTHATLSRYSVRSYHYCLNRLPDEELTVTARWVLGSPAELRPLTLDDRATEVIE